MLDADGHGKKQDFHGYAKPLAINTRIIKRTTFTL